MLRNLSRVLALALLLVAGLAVAACATPEAEMPVEEEALPPVEVEMPTVEVIPTEALTMTEEMTETVMTNDLVTILAADGRFNTLVELLTTAGLTETLTGEGPFTVFAPTDDAFAALPEGTLDALLPDEVTSILLGHVVDGKVMSQDLIDQLAVMTPYDVPTMAMDTIVSFTLEDTVVMINEAISVTQADIEADNGVIHVIDAVILPAAEEAETTE